MAPPGTKVVIHDKPSTRLSWGHHGTVGYYIAPVTEHYRCMTCFIPSTCSECIADTIQFFPHKIDFPAFTLNNHLLNALDKITAILHIKSFRRNNDLLQVDTSTQQALDLITKLLHHSASLPPATPTSMESVSSNKLHKPKSSTVPRVPRVESSTQVFTKTTLPQGNDAALPRVGTTVPVTVNTVHQHLHKRHRTLIPY